MSDSTNVYNSTLTLSRPLTVAQFRELLPEFADTSKYSNTTLQLWLGIAANMLDVNRWADYYNIGISYFVAHKITTSLISQRAAQSGGIPGSQAGAISSKSVGGLSVSFDSSSTAVSGAGNWNMTSYGREFYSLAMMIGMGPIQVMGYDAEQSYLASTITG